MRKKTKITKRIESIKMTMKRKTTKKKWKMTK